MTTCEPQLFKFLKKLPVSFNNYLTVWHIRKREKPKHYGILLRRFCMISCHIFFSSTVKGLLSLKSNWRKFSSCSVRCFRKMCGRCQRTEWFVPNTTTDRGTISFRWIKNLIVLASLWYFGAAKRVHWDLSFCCLAVPPAKVCCFA